MVLDFLLQEKVLLVQGTAFNWPWPDHFRIVTLPRVDDIELSLSKFARFLSGGLSSAVILISLPEIASGSVIPPQ